MISLLPTQFVILSCTMLPKISRSEQEVSHHLTQLIWLFCRNYSARFLQMDWSVSTSSKNYVMLKFLICFPYVLGKVNFFNQLNVYRKTVQKFHYHRWIPFKIKVNTQIQITAHFFSEKPRSLSSNDLSIYLKVFKSRTTGVSTLCSLFQFQSYFSDPLLVHFTQVFFPSWMNTQFSH